MHDFLLVKLFYYISYTETRNDVCNMNWKGGGRLYTYRFFLALLTVISRRENNIQTWNKQKLIWVIIIKLKLQFISNEQISMWYN